jgi:hypothetical protein
MITNIKNFRNSLKPINENCDLNNPSGCLPFDGINPTIKKAKEIVKYVMDMGLSKPDSIAMVQKSLVDPAQVPDDISIAFVQNNIGLIVNMLDEKPDSEFGENINTFDVDTDEYNDLPFEKKSNKLMNIKTFEQFKLDNVNAQIKVQEYLQSILSILDSMKIDDYKNIKSKYGYKYIKVGDWTIFGMPHTNGENETTTEFNTEFNNDIEEISINMNISVSVNFYQVSTQTQTDPADYIDNNNFELQAIAMYDKEGDEYFINITPEIEKISNEIIKNIMNK